MKELIRLEHINVVFQKKKSLLSFNKGIHVLKNINLSINKGEILAIVGESGCGKTTTGKLITGLTRPTSGTIYYKGNRGIPKNVVQFVQQDSYASLNPVNTIYYSLYSAINSNFKKMNKKEINNRIDELMNTVGLVPAVQYLNKYPHQLSGGQRQRVLIARALSLNPEVIVADEPVSMIDVSLRLSILNIMSELNRKLDVTFIYITHDLSTARYVANNGRLCVMYLGEIVELGDLHSIIKSPKHPYTQALLKAVPSVQNNYFGELPITSMELGDLSNRIEGCSFSNRCPYKSSKCEKQVDYQVINSVFVKCNINSSEEKMHE